MNTTIPSNRIIGLELLRIVSMLMIVTLHWGSFGIKILELQPFSFDWYFSWTIRGFAYMSVNLFVFITAYFSFNLQFSPKRLILLWFETIFYSLGIYFLSVVLGDVQFTPKSLIYHATPILSNNYWFITSYFGMYILSPFINKALKVLSLREHTILCIVLSVLFCVVPNFFFWSNWLNWGTSCGIVWFIVLYVIGAYIRRGFDERKINYSRKLLWRYTIISWFLPIASKIIIALIMLKITGSIYGSSVFYMNNSVLILLGSILTFLAFRSLSISGEKTSNIIMFFAKGSLAVYLIHEHDCLRDLIWNYVGEHTCMVSVFFIVDYLVACGLIYLACIIIDFFRRLLFSYTNIHILATNISNFCNRLLTKCLI